MTSRFSFTARVTQKLNHAMALSALDDGFGADAIWEELKKDVYDEAYAVGRSSSTVFCSAPVCVEGTPLASTYRSGFKDACIQRRLVRRENAALLASPMMATTFAVAS
ncbi:hypothetical protein [Halomonas sp. KO116]|uniref:hypothetical protein n=1 Tax=Halomonas sp. KO116 TaxID=1504981 RepID=UPI0004E44B7A|nr:hypothetical protein [Halomonas sp. KO116]AJY53180.1 hypothetical protein KO116_P200073 [Halomonas sp. KO116]